MCSIVEVSKEKAAARHNGNAPRKRLLNSGHLFFIVMSGSSARRTERRNRSVHKVHEDFEHRSTMQLERVINKKRCPTVC